MSGGKGIISTYTRRFKDRYKKFIGISDTDDTKKIKKLEAWGGLTGIYKFLEVNKKKYTNVTGQEVSALEKMKENIENTTNSTNKDGYIKAIECLEEGGDKILLNNGCVSYDVFVNGGDAVAGVDTDAAAPEVVQGDTGTTTAVTSSNETQEESPGDEKGSKEEEDEEPTVEPERIQSGPYDPTPGDNQDNARDDAGDAQADDAEASGTNAEVDDAGATAEAPAAVPVTTETGSGNETDSSQTGTTSTDSDVQDGGGSKRRPKSSRRVKFSKSKKGRTTRRIVRKHRK